MKRIWVGKYGYLYDNAETEYFSFEINATLEKGSFEGTVFEEEFSEATGDTIAIKGFFDDDFISFVKTFPYGFWKDENDDVITDKSVSGHQVVYQGHFDQEKGMWFGEWEIEIDRAVISNDNYDVFAMVGVWEMKVKTDEA